LAPETLETRRAAAWLAIVTATCCGGCNSILNGWLDPTVLGNFRDEGGRSIRSVLTVEDSPWDIPGSSEPTREDLVPIVREYTISAGDVLAIQIEELLIQFVPWQAQVLVDELGDVTVPRLGRVRADGQTVRHFEDTLRRRLVADDILKSPEVLVSPISLLEASYSIFGVGVSAASGAPLRAGTFPIRRPDLRVLDAINQVGGLNEFVTEVYVFRQDVYDRPPQPPAPPAPPPETDAGRDADVNGAAPPPEAGHGERPQDEAAEGAPPDEADLIRDMMEQEQPQSFVTTSQPPESGQEQDEVRFEWDAEAGEFKVREGATAQERAALEAAVPQVPEFESLQSAVDWDRIAGVRNYRVIRIPAEALRSGDRDFNVIVRPKDVIRITSGEIGLYYVMGQVIRPGAYGFNAERVTLKSAIAAAGSLSGLAWPTNCSVYRRNGLREQMIQVDLDAIFAGKEDDFLIRRGDIINVGTSPLAPFLARLRAYTLPNPVSNLGYSFTYSRNFADIDSFSSQINPENVAPRFPGLFP